MGSGKRAREANSLAVFPNWPNRRRSDCRRPGLLKDVEHEVVTRMIPATAGVVVVPALVVDRNSHFRWVAVIHVVAATKVLLAPKVLGVVHVGVVIKAVPISGACLAAPGLTIGPLICGNRFGRGHIAHREHGDDNEVSKHLGVPPLGHSNYIILVRSRSLATHEPDTAYRIYRHKRS